ncbi:glycosyltransferase family 2 protein [Geomonas sp. RF6]|uniref:glycosyltransferase family 2 protein n=1 Tax=Geomonas sp. RF6 TaxID=2897342 RepID=UPI001E3A64EF|nr:glycosyltransferase family A protein [Geomonas sp. RF6]UFS69720.1 glycosyltransferase family 2 protein [Geomonas sp. RF6]
MSAAPKVSVIIPCYNHGAYLDQAVGSVLAQSYQDFEIVVVNDGSSDPETVELLRKYQRPKTRVIHTANCGVSRARNAGISSARGAYILPLDADDFIGERYLEKAVAILDADPAAGVVYCEQEMFGAREGVPPLPPYDATDLLFDNLILSCAMYRKGDWERVGGYSPRFVYGWEDWDFWISLSRLNKKVIKLPEILYYYRIRAGSRDRSMCLRHKIATMGLLIVRHHPLYLKNCGRLLARSARFLSRTLKGVLS